MQSDLVIDLMLEAASPITHMSGTEGNEAVLMREPVIADGSVAHVPVLTGNALRHRALRQSGYLWMIASIDMSGKLRSSMANFLLNGGAVSQSTRDADLKGVAEAIELLPLLGMLGGCLPNQIIPGRASVGRAVLACRENAERVSSLFPDWSDGIGALRPADDFVGGYQYTRGEASRYVQTDADPQDASNLMIFSGESVISGAVFFSRMRFRRPTDMQAGAVLHALGLWDGNIGGQSSRGHGQLHVSARVHGEVEKKSLVSGYVTHVKERGQEIREWLETRFAK